MMMPCHFDDDVFESKTDRAEHRAHSLCKKRIKYQQSLDAQPKPKPSSMVRKTAGRPSGLAHALAPVPHGAARTMTRTCLSKGLVAGPDDMPTTSMGQAGRWVPCLRKPSVSRILLSGEAGSNSAHYESSNTPTADKRIPYKISLKTHLEVDVLDAVTTAGSGYSDSGQDSTTDESTQSCSDNERYVVSEHGDQVHLAKHTDDSLPKVEVAPSILVSDDPEEHVREAKNDNTSKSVKKPTGLKQKRKRAPHCEFFKQKANVAHDQKASVEVEIMVKAELAGRIESETHAAKERAVQEAQAIKAKAVLEAVSIRKDAKEVTAKAKAVLEGQVKATMQAERKAEALATKEAATALKHVKELEKRQAKKFKKEAGLERNNEQQKERTLEAARVQAAREKELASEEAAMIRAEAYAISNKINDQARVQVAASASARAKILKAQEDAEALKQQRLQEMAQAEAELKERTEAELQAKRVALEQELSKLQIEVEADVHAKLQLVAKVQRDAQVAKENAEQEAHAIKAQAVLSAVSVRRTAEQAIASAKAELETQREAVAQAERDAKMLTQKEAAASLKQAKELVKQNARKFKKESELEKQISQQKDRELEGARAQAAEEKAQAVAEAARIRADAFAIRSKIKEEARMQALADAAAIRAVAEAELREAQALREQLAVIEVKASPSNGEEDGETDVAMPERMLLGDVALSVSTEQVGVADVDWELVSCAAEAVEVADEDGCIEHEGDCWAMLD